MPHASVRVAPQLVLQPAWYKSCMVDFKKRLSGPKNGAKPLIPAEIYDKADRESDTRPLRPAQISVLDEWQNQRRATRDVNIKMHTGQKRFQQIVWYKAPPEGHDFRARADRYSPFWWCRLLNVPVIVRLPICAILPQSEGHPSPLV